MSRESIAFYFGLLLGFVGVLALHWGWDYLITMGIVMVLIEIAWPRFKRWVKQEERNV